MSQMSVRRPGRRPRKITGGGMTKPLAAEVATFEKIKGRLQAEHPDKFVLIHDSELVGTYDTFQTAAKEGLDRFGDLPFLVREVSAGPVTLSPAVLYGLCFRADSDDSLRS